MRIIFQKLHVTGILIILYLFIRITLANILNEEISTVLLTPTLIFFVLVFILDPLLNSGKSMKKFYKNSEVILLSILIIIALEYFTFWFE